MARTQNFIAQCTNNIPCTFLVFAAVEAFQGVVTSKKFLNALSSLHFWHVKYLLKGTAHKSSKKTLQTSATSESLEDSSVFIEKENRHNTEL